MSLCPPATETLALIGADDRVVGRFEDIPDAERLAELRPDLIIADGSDGRPIPASDAEVVRLNPKTVEDILDDILRVGRAVGMERSAMHAVVSLRERADRALEHVNPYTDGAAVGFLSGTDPLTVAGHWAVQLIERAGGRHPLNETVAKPGSGAAVGPQQAERIAGPPIAVPLEMFAAVRPGVVIVASKGRPLDEVWSETQRLSEQGWFRELPAYKAGRIAVVDGVRMFNAPTPGVFDALEFLVGYLNDRPGLIPPGFPWRAWNGA